MAKYTGIILTNKGKELLARAIIAQELITFTKVEIGSGDILPEELPEELTGLKGSFKVLNITSTTVLEDGAFRIRVAFDNAGIVSDTYLKEIGVFARGEDGIEVLYSYCNTDDPDLIPGEGSGVIERVEDLITYISNATTINAIIDQSNVYATIKDLTDGLNTKENKFTKNSGFNRAKSDSVSLDDTNTIGTSKAIKIAYDKGVEAKNTADGKEPAFVKNSGFNKNKSDSYSLDDSNVLATSKALKDGLATTFKISDCYYGIGDYWITESTTNPATKWAGTVWEKLEGRMLFGANGTTYLVGAEGGVTQVTLSVANMPSHRHQVDSHSHTQPTHYHETGKISGERSTYYVADYGYTSTSGTGSRFYQENSVSSRFPHTSSSGGDNSGSASPYTNYQGSGTAFNVLNSYRAVNIWRRTA
ncbi:phage baseplate protein [uncultured Ilyobacter sp.]|uniref:phage baseplate protein n=1 Tax=uncultured Ilyobacter sp. TaxID=544433 RepID=UPI0029C78453|nr:phage tail protein [uncultured Ilyobacter sp.]